MNSFALNNRTGSEADLMSGLCCERQLEIGAQEARKLRCDLSDDALLELAKTVHERSGDSVTRSTFGPKADTRKRY